MKKLYFHTANVSSLYTSGADIPMSDLEEGIVCLTTSPTHPFWMDSSQEILSYEVVLEEGVEPTLNRREHFFEVLPEEIQAFRDFDFVAPRRREVTRPLVASTDWLGRITYLQEGYRVEC